MSELDAALQVAARALDAQDPHTAHAALAPFADRLPDDPELARLWAGLLHHVADPAALTAELGRFAQVWLQAPTVLQVAADAAVRWCRQRPLASPAEREPVARAAAEALRRCLHARGGGRGPVERHALHLGLAAALVEIGPSVDDDALTAFELALEAQPDDGAGFFALARLHTRRGRWRKGLDATRHALTLTDAPPLHWNLAVCATALGDATTAETAWRALAHDPIRAAHGVPGEVWVADLPPVEVCLTPTTLDVTGAPAGGPWAVEAVWVQPLSPAHGRVAHPTRLDGAADFDDVVLWDGTPLSFRPVDGRDVPRFAALAVLRTGRARTVRVSGALPYPKALMRVDAALPAGAFVHPFDPPRKGPFEGKLVCPRGADLDTVRAAAREAAAAAEVVWVEAPP